MTKERKVTVRYSDCFKRSVIEEIEKNGLSIEDCRRKYAIGGATTIQKWLKMYGKNHLLNKIVRVETIDEIQEIKALKKASFPPMINSSTCTLSFILCDSLDFIASRTFCIK